MARFDDVLEGVLQPRGCDRLGLGIELVDGFTDRTHGARAARASIPAAASERCLHGLELESRGHARAVDSLGRDLAIAEETLAQRNAAHLQTLELERCETLADDQLGAAAADVDDEALSRLARHGMGHSGVDEARLLHAGNDLDRMSQRFARPFQEGLFAMRRSKRVRSHDPHAVGPHIA